MRTIGTLLAVATLLGACGQRPPRAPTGPVLEFRLDYAAARRDSLTRAAETDEALQRKVIDILRKRIRAVAGPTSLVEAKGTDGVRVRLEAGADPVEVKEVVVAPGGGSLQFRILVDPTRVEDGPVKSLWEGTATEWHAYRAAEVAEWKEARKRGLPYRPTKDPKYRVVKRSETSGGSPEDFVVVAEPLPTERFGGEILANVRPVTDEQGMPAVAYDVKEEYQASFGAWTGKHVGHPMAILHSNEFMQAPIIRVKLTDTVQITLGGAGLDAEALAALRKRQRALVVLLVSGPLPVPVEAVAPTAEEPAPPK